MARSLGAALLLGFGVAPALALDPQRAVTRAPGHDAWTHQSGLPGEAVYEIVSTPDGYLVDAHVDGPGPVPSTALDSPRRGSSRARGRRWSTGSGHLQERGLGDLLVRGVAQTHLCRSGEFASYLPQQALPGGWSG